MYDSGILSFNGHHLEEKEITDAVTQGGYFELIKKGKKTYTFKKATPSPEGN